MKKLLTVRASFALILSAACNANAANCTSSPLMRNAAQSLVGRLVSAAAPLPSTDTWNEQHQGTTAGGSICEEALGTNAVDPAHNNGTWAPVGGQPAQIFYDYGAGGGTYTWTYRTDAFQGIPFFPPILIGIPFDVAICNGASLIATATVKANTVTCPNP